MVYDQFATRSNQPRLLRYYKWSLAAGWTAVIAVLLVINFNHERAQALETARTQARSMYQRDVVYRHWNANSGAVYVPVTDNVRPNPYLAHLAERDVVTTTGTALTLVNPSYMTRLVFDLASQHYGIKGHITSLRPIRPENFADAWESAALESFAAGSQEASSIEEIDGASYLRLMKPLRTEAQCLKCHARQGYRVGEVRGGLSVAIPMQPLWDIARKNYLLDSASFSIIWGMGLAGIFFGSARLARTIRQRDEAERDIITLNEDLLSRGNELEAANRELEAFCSTVSHDLRSPLTIIGGYCQLIRETPEHDHMEVCGTATEMILNSSGKMEALIATLLQFSRLSREPLTCTDVDLSAMAGEIMSELRITDPQRAAMVTIADGLTVRGDEALLRVVLQNLLGNAWKYSSKVVETHIDVGVTDRDGAKAFFVRDNGIGFDIGQAETMFEAFQRLPNAKGFEGTGIGLATVKRIVTRHGGRIECAGAPGKGATFYLFL